MAKKTTKKKTAKKKTTARKAARRPAKKAAKRTTTAAKKKTTRRTTAKPKAKAATGPKKITASATPRTRSQQLTALADSCDMTRKQVTHVFDALEQMDAVAFLHRRDANSADLIVATDVLVYMRGLEDLMRDDGDSADKHLEFYDEYLSVLDLTEEFYLQTVDYVFQRYLLPKGELVHQGRLVDPGQVKDIGLLTVEGENDDISGIGQTQAAHDLCANLPGDLKVDYVQPHVGHYGVFNGRRFREEIYPRVRDFIADHQSRFDKSAKPA